MPYSNLFIISGPSGSGESTITGEIIRKFPNFKKLVTATTRSPRNSEKNGKDYYFFSEHEFEEEIKRGNIVEYTYIENRGVYYGSYKPDLENKLREGFSVIANVDIVGTKYYKTNYNAIAIFIRPDSLENVKRRLLKRDNNITAEELEKRLKNAADEIENEEKYYDFIVVNEEGKLEKAVKEVAEIIKRHEKSNQTSPKRIISELSVSEKF